MKTRFLLITAILLIGLLAACAPALTAPAQQEEATPTPEAEPSAAEVLTDTGRGRDTAVLTDTVPLTSTATLTEQLRLDPSDTLTQTAEGVYFINPDQGVVSLSGLLTYTNPFFTAGVAQPVIILEDQAGFVDRNQFFLMPLASQTMAQITSDFFTSPFSYSLALPIEPQGSYRDVANITAPASVTETVTQEEAEEEAEETNPETAQGVQIYAVAYWTNTFGDPFLEERDLGGGGWSTAYASTRTSTNASTDREIIGGQLLIYAPDDQQQFPAHFGEDGLLFTGDETLLVTLPQGYTIVNLDFEPFIFDRRARQQVNLLEPEGAALVDYSDLTYTAAFTGLVEQMSREYAFTELKEIDWDELRETYQPFMEEADRLGNAAIYRRALRDFTWQIPDGHVSGPFLQQEFSEEVSGGLGLAIRDVDDGRVLVSFLLANSPADEAGIELGAEIIALDGITATLAVDETVAFSAPFSTPHVERLQKLRYAVRFPLDTEVEVAYLNPEETEVMTATLTAVFEQESFSASSFLEGTDGFELPVEFSLLPSGYGYVKIDSFFDNQVLTVQLWERMINDLNSNGVPGLIIDMRQNGGGFGFLADQMGAYFFQEPHLLGNTGYFNEELEEFYFDERGENRFILPAEELRYDGDVVVLVGPACASACEFFSYNMTINNRAEIVGHYPTAGLGGSVTDVRMPEGETVRFTVGQAVNAEGEIHLEGIGAVPTVQVPVTEETLFAAGDVVLDTAVSLLNDGPTSQIEPLDAGEITVGDIINGELELGTRLAYTLPVTTGQLLTILVEAAPNSDFDPILRLYDATTGELLLENDDLNQDTFNSGVEELEIPLDLTLRLEIGGYDDNSAGEFILSIISIE